MGFGKRGGAQEASSQGAKIAKTTASSEGSGVQTQAALQQSYENEAMNWQAASGSHIDKYTRDVIHQGVMAQINPEDITQLSREELSATISALVADVVTVQGIAIGEADQNSITDELVKDMLGFGPLDDLLGDDEINDILINGPWRIYVERRGKMELTNIRFRDQNHLLNISQRIAVLTGRHVDETSPLTDARLPDGSRVHIAVPPVAPDGPYVSIRKFSKQTIDFDVLVNNNSISKNMASLLDVASICRLNILVAGGTGAGKTTVLNALSQKIESTQRILTVEDTLELQLQQPHVVRMECRAANSEGVGSIDIRELVRNALRMRPDRIIVGEVRGAEIFDMLQAMNTGHDGSMATIHSNNPRDALSRCENMMAQTGMNLPVNVVRQYITSAIDMVVYTERMRDGVRRISSVIEVVGMEGEAMVVQPLFEYKFESEDPEGGLSGNFECSNIKPRFFERARYFGVADMLTEAMELDGDE